MRQLVMVLSLLVLLPACALAQTPLERYRDSAPFIGPDRDLEAWDTALHDVVVKQHKTPAAAARLLAPRFHLTQGQFLRLERLWFRIGLINIGYDLPRDVLAAQRKALRPGFFRLVRETHRLPLVLAAAAVALTDFYYDCAPEVFHGLTGGAADRGLGWHLLETSRCWQWREHLRRTPVLALAAQFDSAALDERLALSDYLVTPEALEHVEAADRDFVRRYFSYEHLWDLLNDGLLQDAFADLAALPGDVRQSLLTVPLETRRVVIDGQSLEIRIGGGHDGTADMMRVALAAAHYLAGDDPAAARAFLDDGLFARGRLRLDCPLPPVHMTIDERLNGRCESTYPVTTAMAFLELALNRPDDDIYGFLEQSYGDSLLTPMAGGAPLPQTRLWHAALCKRAKEAAYARLCEGFLTYPHDPEPDLRVVHAMLGRRLGGAVRDWHIKLAAAREALGLHTPTPSVIYDGSYNTPPFAERRLPRALRTPNRPENEEALPWPSGMAPLPTGFAPVRVDVSGHEAVAISRSYGLDPTGGVFSESYWVLLSHDGGRHWEKPLYTALIDRYPYVVESRSRLPMIAGNTLRVEVRIEQADHPNAAMSFTVRSVKDLYLRIPLAVLKRDSDGDGLTDLLETHLLLDPHKADSDGDGIPDGDDAMPNIAEAPQGDAALASAVAAALQFLQKRTSADDGTLSTPVAPALINGDPKLFASLRLPYPVLILDPSELRHVSPDFDEIYFAIVLNRTGDRGYARYGQKYGGGSLGLIRDATGWHVKDISGWVT